MKRLIQIRKVPEDMHRRIKARAALAGMTMSDFLVVELEKILERPTRGELLARIAELPTVGDDIDIVKEVRQERDSR